MVNPKSDLILVTLDLALESCCRIFWIKNCL